MTPIDAVFAAAALLFLVLFVREKSCARRAAVLEEELAKLKAEPETAELRLDRFELLWFVSVSYSSARKMILKVTPGLPHCRKCIEPLRNQGKEWVCPGCGDKRPESVADIMVMDSVGKEALEQFLERHRGYGRPTA